MCCAIDCCRGNVLYFMDISLQREEGKIKRENQCLCCVTYWIQRELSCCKLASLFMHIHETITTAGECCDEVLFMLNVVSFAKFPEVAAGEQIKEAIMNCINLWMSLKF